jgi:hypothetical protein
MGRHWRKAAWWCLAVVLVVAVVLPAASGVAAVTQTRAVPGKLVGKWSRNVTSADIKRTGGTGVPAGSVCTLTVKTSGVAHIGCTVIGGFDGSIVPAGANRIHINLGLLYPDIYSWHVSGRLLTLTKLSDTVADREAVFWGVWKRK